MNVLQLRKVGLLLYGRTLYFFHFFRQDVPDKGVIIT